MDVFQSYCYGTAGWAAIQSLPLIISPTMIVAMLSPEVREASELEVYFSRSLGVTLFVLGVLTMLLTGVVPLKASMSDINASEAVTTSTNDPKAPYALPTLVITMLYHASACFYCYALWTSLGVSAFMLGCIGSGALAAMGLWCVLFASSDGRISRKTGADKRTSGFPFKNQKAHSEIKKGL
ncbi:hypothetical protein EJ08DRAFT_666118 [Tothia fuscella]|uniref:Uncharacterized protein n=1 Tax=Tothia fuscella TaxID=1048955 RepID=A0A9P4NF70_9PEZI|nr:hypothetical protein EJ08DRAFT_666118 [Tothia fuscella]